MMNWGKNNEVVEKYHIERSAVDMILSILVTVILCYALSLFITFAAGKWFNIIFFVDTVQKVAGFGVMFSLIAFAPRIFRARYISDSTNLKEEHIYTKSEMKSKLSQIDIIAFTGCMITIFTSLLLTPLYHQQLSVVG